MYTSSFLDYLNPLLLVLHVVLSSLRYDENFALTLRYVSNAVTLEPSAWKKLRLRKFQSFVIYLLLHPSITGSALYLRASWRALIVSYSPTPHWPPPSSVFGSESACPDLVQIVQQVTAAANRKKPQ